MNELEIITNMKNLFFFVSGLLIFECLEMCIVNRFDLYQSEIPRLFNQSNVHKFINELPFVSFDKTQRVIVKKVVEQKLIFADKIEIF